MDVKKAIEQRRAYRSLDKTVITKELIEDLAKNARLSASCFNNQPWRFIFVYDSQVLERMHDVLTKGNRWAYDASMIIVVVSKKEYDCIIRDRTYYQFDSGMATALLILRATELGFVAHPIAGFSPKKTREILNIPDDMEVITLVIFGKHSKKIKAVLSDEQKQKERKRPNRFKLDKFVFHNTYS